MEPEQIKLKEIILNIKEPHIIKNLKIPWNCFEIPFDKWCELYTNNISGQTKDGVEFDTGKRKHTNSPQWEKYRFKAKMTVTDFLKNSLIEDEFFKENWATLSYKNLSELPMVCREGINFKCFGFPDLTEDMTFWLSSTGAHTSCHYDTYGCNIVVQVYGRKLWLLFPPEANLSKVRVPYEESSVYCSEPFFSPSDFSVFQDVKGDCYKCILEPGDALIVPAKWWHYVENLCPALSINTWVPLQQDIETNIEECIVKIFIEHFVKDRESQDARDILNPNEMSLMPDLKELFEILKYLTQNRSNLFEEDSDGTKKFPYCYVEDENLKEKIKQFNGEIIPVPKISEDEFSKIIEEHKLRYDSGISKDPSADSVKHRLINSFCNPNVIKIVKEYFLKNVRR